ncbi:hypothetical protein A9168_07925 [Macellibacteroides sp. HH-ZS]|nr:hypothetical protein A9168_07925 [Macellibacteroides sp. HH-ZS]
MHIREIVKSLKNELIHVPNLIRIRGIHLKLFGDYRRGFYWEVSIKDFVEEFRAFCQQNEQKEEAFKRTLSSSPNFVILQRLCEQYYIHEDSANFQNKIIKEVQEIIDEIRDDAKTQNALEEWLDATQNGVVSRFKADFPELKESDIKLFCFLVAGFTSTMISVFLRKEKNVVYNRSSRLKAKIRDKGYRI